MVYDSETGTYLTFVPGNPDNPDHLIKSGDGLMVHALEGRTVNLGPEECTSVNLETGFNLKGFCCPGTGYSAFELLNGIGSAAITSTQRFNTDTGRFETAAYNADGDLYGIDFKIVPGKGFFVEMKTQINGFQME